MFWPCSKDMCLYVIFLFSRADGRQSSAPEIIVHCHSSGIIYTRLFQLLCSCLVFHIWGHFNSCYWFERIFCFAPFRLITSQIAKLLKKLLKQSRPALSNKWNSQTHLKKQDYGMPSSHASTATFFASYSIM